MCREEQRDNWKITVKCGTHNHMICKSLHGNTLAGRPTADELEVIEKMTLGHCPLNKVATVLNANPKNVTSKKQVCNNMYKVRKGRMDGRTVVQDFLYQCHQKDYYTEHRINASTNQIQDIFFTHPDSIQLLKSFLHIIVLDSTYSTTRYDRPFFEIIDILSTWKNFNIAGAFLAHESEESYVWVIVQLEKLFLLVEREQLCLIT